jgi:voltage-gated potassium channel
VIACRCYPGITEPLRWICDPGLVDPIPVKRPKIRERVEAKPPTLWRAIGVIVVATGVFVVLAAVAMRLADPDQFPNMGEALWFSVETVSTVGYGDVVPTTGPGKLVAGVIMMVGLAFVPAVTAIVVSTFVARREAQSPPSASVVREPPDPADSE